MLKFVIFTLAFSVTAIIANERACIPAKGVFGCAYMPRCYGDSMCGAGQKCCPHPCGNHSRTHRAQPDGYENGGNQCQLIVNCDKIDCHLKCQYGLERDVKGCNVCKCRTTKKCVGVSTIIDI